MYFREALSRAFFLATLSLVASSALFAQKAQLLVTDTSAGTVTVFDPGLGVIATITLPPPASGALNTIAVAVNPSKTLAAVSNFNANRIDFLDLTVTSPVLTGTSVNWLTVS